MNKAQKILESKIRKMVRNKLAEMLIAGYGFSKNDLGKLNLLRHEASINKKDDFEPPVKAGKGGAPSTEPPVQKDFGDDTGLDTPKNGKNTLGGDSPFGTGKSDKPKEEKAKSKDWTELTDEVSLYINNAANMIGDSEGAQKSKILDKLYDEVAKRFSEVPEEMGADVDSGLDEKKKAKKKKK